MSPLTALLSRIDAVTEGADNGDTLPTGFPSVDRALGGGLRRGDLAVLGGDVGSGKSALALGIALRGAASRAVTFLSGEMQSDRLRERMLAIEGRARIDDLRRGTLDESVRASVGAAAVRLGTRVPEFGRLPNQVQSIKSGMAEDGSTPDLLVIDSIQGLGGDARDQAEEQAAAVRELKALALDTGIAILATCQLPLLSARADRRPQLDDFGALGAVKHHADIVLALYRESMYDAARDVEGATELLIRKNRHGAVGYVDLYFYAQWMRFEDMLDPDR